MDGFFKRPKTIMCAITTFISSGVVFLQSLNLTFWLVLRPLANLSIILPWFPECKFFLDIGIHVFTDDSPHFVFEKIDQNTHWALQFAY